MTAPLERGALSLSLFLNPMLTKIDLDEVEYKLYIEIKYFKEYLIFNEKELSIRQEIYKKQFLEDLLEFPRKDIIEHLYKEDLTKFPSYFYHSSLILVFTIFETTLKEICEEVTKKLTLPVGVDELYGNNIIVKSIDYLKKFCELDLAEVDKEWMDVRRFQRIRNLIVHNNARLPDSKLNSEEHKSLVKVNSITVDIYGNFFITSSKPIIGLLDSMNSFVSIIIKRLTNSEYNQYNIKKKPNTLQFPFEAYWDDDDGLPF